jgi:hypothetical protein
MPDIVLKLIWWALGVEVVVVKVALRLFVEEKKRLEQG